MGRHKKKIIIKEIPTVHDIHFVPPEIKTEEEFDSLYNLDKIDLIFNPIINHVWYGIREMLPEEIEYLKRFKKEWILQQLKI